MRRRRFLGIVSGAAATWPIAARGQQPVIGYLGSGHPSSAVSIMFRRGLAETGFIAGANVIIEARFAGGLYERLPVLATELVDRGVSVLVASGGIQTALAAKAATTSIPIVFAHGSDPVEFGLVASLSRPGGNVTGISHLSAGLEAKRLGLLHEIVPEATSIAVLVNPAAANAPKQAEEISQAARALGLSLRFIQARTPSELSAAFPKAVEASTALLVIGDPLFFNIREHLIELAARHRLPTIYDFRAYPEAGGFASYGTDLGEAYRQVGIYVGRILKGEEPRNLPVLRSAKFEFVVNLRTAKALGLEIPPLVLARADEVFE